MKTFNDIRESYGSSASGESLNKIDLDSFYGAWISTKKKKIYYAVDGWEHAAMLTKGELDFGGTSFPDKDEEEELFVEAFNKGFIRLVFENNNILSIMGKQKDMKKISDVLIQASLKSTTVVVDFHISKKRFKHKKYEMMMGQSGRIDIRKDLN